MRHPKFTTSTCGDLQNHARETSAIDEYCHGIHDFPRKACEVTNLI